MKPGDWIVIPNWEEFQHYEDRDPIWIKNYVSLTADDDYLSLSSHCRAVLHGVWLEYARSDGRLPLDTASLTRRLALRVTSANIKSLSDAGFIQLSASRPLALARSREKNSLRSKKNARVPAREESKSTKARKGATGWRIVRGSHGMSTIPDPNGTDPAPTIGRPL